MQRLLNASPQTSYRQPLAGTPSASPPGSTSPTLASPSPGATAAPGSASTNCSAVSTDRFDRQPPDLRRVLAASFEDPAAWFAGLDSERRLALVSIFNRMCRFRLWPRVRLVLKVVAGEPPVGHLFTAPGRTPSVYFTSRSGGDLRDALMASGRFCLAYGLGASQHAGQPTLREISGSDSLHISIGPGDQFDAHIDRYSPVPTYPGSSFCPNEPTPAALAHIGREVVPEKVRGVTGIPGVQVFPEPPPAAPVPEGAVAPEPYRSAPGFTPVGVAGLLLGGLLESTRITLHGPRKAPARPLVPAEPERGSPDVVALPPETATRIARALDAQVSREALLPSRARRRLEAARHALDVAGPDEEKVRRAARDEAEAAASSYADAHVVALDLAARMEHARRRGLARVTIELGASYGGIGAASRAAIAGEVRRIALILRNHLPERAAGVRYVLVIFGAGRKRKSAVVELP